MDSTKSTPRQPLAPQRERGKRRVAELLEAAKGVFAEKGFEAGTMAEIAARAGAPIGSLYRFFPNKEAVADALMAESRALIDAGFTTLRERAPGLAAAALADALLALMIELRGRTRATLALMEGQAGWDERRAAFRGEIHRQILQVLQAYRPAAAPALLEDMAGALHQAMKAMVRLTVEGASEGTREELRVMVRLYLGQRLGAAE